ncbi:uncharacterized protein P174DRAFT_450890 [Aspergillus novofumigatus IBT 16806]|uniref:Uncharacterized protein n=1 Tax=Aspergillus novofumigatus (strain IBT 16806) TaxID=1392255 RepID=A0A2I1C8M9_ASPN1|nr:uncharacterized protein P174DRAFT_450890 [Aspergillus novofumigatus IBT 16806]PKX93945.1 hypothetical protein P174DRAFT_450890 [Aspergillus novofumigatus IBT 16806]
MRRLKGRHRLAIRQRCRQVLLPTPQGFRVIGGVERNRAGSRFLTSEHLFRRV